MQYTQVEGFEAYDIYEDGRLFSRYSNRFLKPFKHSVRKGNTPWWAYKLCKDGFEKTIAVQRLVALHFIPNPEDLSTVNHRDGDKSNNHISNLEWATSGDNKRHAFETGVSVAWWHGSMVGTAKSNEEEIHKACELFDQGLYPTEVGRILNIPTARLDKVHARINWKRVSEDYHWWRK